MDTKDISEIITFSRTPNITIPSARVFKDASAEKGLSDGIALAVGVGGKLYFKTSNSDLGSVLILLERARRDIIDKAEKGQL